MGKKRIQIPRRSGKSKRSRSLNKRVRHKNETSSSRSPVEAGKSTFFDRCYAGFFLFTLWGNVSVDVWMGLDINLLGTGLSFHRTVYDAGKAFDPLFIENSPYMQYSALLTAVLFAPFYMISLPSLFRGAGFGMRGTFRRMYAYIYAVGMAANMGIVLFMEFREYILGSNLAPSMGFYWIPCGAYFVVPLMLLVRLLKEDGQFYNTQTGNSLQPVDWEIPPLSNGKMQHIFERLTGPGMTGWETVLTGISMIGTCYTAHISSIGSWSPLQYRTSLFLAVIDGSAVVQCATGTSKRWYHPKGRLPFYLFATMTVEIMLQCIIIGFGFCDSLLDSFSFAVITSAWFLVCMVTVRSTPLHAQRPMALLCLLASVALLNSSLIPRIEGMEWITIVLPTKYLVSHLTRHEPYIDIEN